MDKKEEQKLRDEINYATQQQEVSKFNFNQVTVTFFGAISILIILFQIIIAIGWTSKIWIQGFLLLCIVVITIKSLNDRNNTKNQFGAFDEIIEEKYTKLNELKKGEFKRRLNDEIIPIKEKLDSKSKLENYKIWLIALTIVLVGNIIITYTLLIKLGIIK